MRPHTHTDKHTCTSSLTVHIYIYTIHSCICVFMHTLHTHSFPKTCAGPTWTRLQCKHAAAAKHSHTNTAVHIKKSSNKIATVNRCVLNQERVHVNKRKSACEQAHRSPYIHTTTWHRMNIHRICTLHTLSTLRRTCRMSINISVQKSSDSDDFQPRWKTYTTPQRAPTIWHIPGDRQSRSTPMLGFLSSQLLSSPLRTSARNPEQESGLSNIEGRLLVCNRQLLLWKLWRS